MGLNPSCNSVEGKGFYNLGDPPFSSDRKDIAMKELLEAGLPRGSVTFTTIEREVYKPDSEAAQLARSGISIPAVNAKSETEWINLHTVTAKAYGWEFRRAWYYWVCKTEHAHVPLELARKLHAEHGGYVRTEGFAGGQVPTSDIRSYHVDTPAGLKVLVDLFRQEHERREAERQAEFQRKYGM